MGSETLLLNYLNKSFHNFQEDVIYRCRVSKELEYSGNYEAARGALGSIWQKIGERPDLSRLDPYGSAEVLLRVGSLTGWLGSSTGLSGAQDLAKDLITESQRLFESIGNRDKRAEAQIELSLCYWREGAYSEARIILLDAYENTDEANKEQKLIALTRVAEMERASSYYEDALKTLAQAAPLLDQTDSNTAKGRYHITKALAYKNLSVLEKRTDYADKALIEYSAASYYYQQAKHLRYYARVENNIGNLLLTLNRFDEAHEHFNRARDLFKAYNDKTNIALVDESRAKTFLAQGRLLDAEKTVCKSISIYEHLEQYALLAEALATYAITLSRLNRKQDAQYNFERAIEAAERVGDYESAGNAAIHMIEELSDYLNVQALYSIYQRADSILVNSPNRSTKERLHQSLKRIAAEFFSPKKSSFTYNFVYASKETEKLLNQAKSFSKSSRPVLIVGETGTGKEILAHKIHEWSNRNGRLVTVNCAAINDTLAESQLFGHIKGSFTDATCDHIGYVQEAEGGTLFLDEIGEMSLTAQAKLLRFIETGEYRPVGSTTNRYANVRVVAATNRNLFEAVKKGTFREDLLFRINVINLEIPPLRERREDIPALALHFIKEAEGQYEKRVEFTPESLESMKNLPLSANARELKNIIERVFLLAPLDRLHRITAEAVEIVALRNSMNSNLVNEWEGFNLSDQVHKYEAEWISRALKASKGSVTQAARLLGIKYQNLTFMLNNRHQNLLSDRTAPQKRKSSIIPKRFKEHSC
jgi:DNA-binding NtrC family response regulator/Tfp pilus assembly protein PilF